MAPLDTASEIHRAMVCVLACACTVHVTLSLIVANNIIGLYISLNVLDTHGQYPLLVHNTAGRDTINVMYYTLGLNAADM